MKFNYKRRSRVALGAIVFIIIMIALVELTLLSSPARGSGGPGDETGGDMQATPTTEVLFIDPRMAEPTLPADPLLADRGAHVYWFVCVACHGDQGQGLTEEFRQMAFGEDMNCWQSRCHASNHPPEGFEFPRIVPAVTGPGTLRRFVNAAELQDYIYTKMPWWNPGLLTIEESWQLTAFLLRQNGSLPGTLELNVSQASTVPVHLSIKPEGSDQAGQIVLVFTLGMAAIVGFAAQAMQRYEPVNGNSRTGKRPHFLLHLHPPSIPAIQARWRYTLGAGGTAVFLAIILIITGVLEMFFYIPTPEKAGSSIQLITFSVPFGSLVRGIHYWAAQAMVVVVVIHMLRILFTGTFIQPRRLNYWIGLVLLILTLFFDFTGYVLRWDEGIRWALTVGTNLLKTMPFLGESLYSFVIGGEKPGLATITRFYAWHIFGLTLIFIILVVWHIFRVRRDGGISAPEPQERQDNQRVSRSELGSREGLAMLLLSIGLVLAATFVPPPLAAPIYDSGASSLVENRAPWFFLWIQYLLRFGDAFWMGIAVPIGLLLLLGFLPLVTKRIPEKDKGQWFGRSTRLAQVIGMILAIGWMILTLLALKV